MIRKKYPFSIDNLFSLDKHSMNIQQEFSKYSTGIQWTFNNHNYFYGEKQ